MDVTDAVNFVRRRHNAVSDSFFSDAEIYKMIEARANEVLSFIGLIEAVDTSITTVDGTQTYSLPSGWERVRKCYVNNEPCAQITFEEWDSEKTRGTTDPEGEPDRFFVWNYTLYLVPTPATTGQTVTLYGHKRQGTIDDTADTIDIPDVLQFRMLDGVIADMFAKDSNDNMFARYQKIWEEQHIPAFQLFASQRRTQGGFVQAPMDCE